MDRSNDFDAAFNESLGIIDRSLAQRNMALQARPLAAAMNFVTYCIEHVRYKDQNEFQPGNFTNYANSDWFKIIFSKTHSWYLARYGEAMQMQRESGISGVTVAYDTPFLLKVPITTVEPETPGETIWICFHDSVRANEDVLKWLVNGPNFAIASKSDGMKARRMATEVANRLRSIKIQLMGLAVADPRAAELLGEIIPHLERAAQQVVRGGADDYKRAHWDIQMACEFPLKLLAQWRSGVFQETHDLFCLYDRIPGGSPSFKRSLLSKIPNWERMAEWRYGAGVDVSLDDTFRRYLAALQIIDMTLIEAKPKYGFGNAKFLTRMPPWMELVVK